MDDEEQGHGVRGVYILALEAVKPGMTLGRDIHHADGRVLLVRGAILREHHLRRLREMDIRFLYVDDGRYGLVQLDDAVAEETRARAEAEVHRVMNAVAAGSGFASQRLARAVEDLIDEVLANRGNLVSLTDIRAMRDYTFAHSVGVAVFSLTIAVQMGLERAELLALGTGALLHDLGKSLVPPTVLNKPSALTPQEFAEVQRHVDLGYRLLAERPDLGLEPARVARYHHERLDGSGYPCGLTGQSIPFFARIAAVADVFDAMSTDRVYRRRYLPHETMETLKGGAGTLFDPEVIRAFCEAVAVYPNGSVVRLNNGLIGVVVQQNRTFPGRPVVRVRLTEGGPERLVDLDLLSELTLFVTEVLVSQPV